MRSKPTISVVMATFNRAQYLEESINSALNQTFQDFEFIIIDDASTDKTTKILEKYKKKKNIRVIRNKKNLGLAASLNRGIDMARGKWIARQDDDDISHPERFELQYNYLVNNPEIKLLGSRAEFTTEDLRTFSHWDVPESHDEIKKLIQWESPFCHPSVIFEKKSICSIGKYRSKFRLVEDYDLWTRTVALFPTHNLPQYLVKVRRHKHSVSINHLDEQLASHVIAYIFSEQRKKIGADRYDEMPSSGFAAYLNRAYPEYISFFRELRKKKYRAFLYEAKRSRDWQKGIYFSARLALLNPTNPEWIRESTFFTRAYFHSLMDKHLLWRIAKFRSQ